jgi:predicted MPP superfamily phosphohydrolase
VIQRGSLGGASLDWTESARALECGDLFLIGAPTSPPIPRRFSERPAIPGRFRVRRFAGPRVHSRQLDHLRVVHLTDLHVGRLTSGHVIASAVSLANAQRPDLVVVTGDFVCHSQKHLGRLTQVIASFEAPVLCVLGNHDHWSGAREVRMALRQGGAEVLDNAWTTLTLRGQRLQVVGLDDAYTGHHDVGRATRGLRRGIATLGLSHIAEQADALWPLGVPLVLSGHTHAGQVTWASLHELTLGRIIGHKYVHGLYGSRRHTEYGRGAVYVGAGVGSSVVPVRFGERAQREVTVFDLGVEPGAFPEPHSEQPGHRGREPSARKQYRRAAAVIRKESRRAGRGTSTSRRPSDPSRLANWARGR